jgi:sugar phosphate permease
MYLCSQWYPPDALALRLSLLTSFSAASGAFSGGLAAVISRLGGLGGLTSWQWIFFIEGCVTVLLGIATFFLLIDSPERSRRWIVDDELRFLKLQRSVKDGGEAAIQNATRWDDFKAILKDWRYWAFGAFFFCIGALGFGLEFVIPTMIRGLGYSRTRSQLLSTIPYVCGFIMSLISSWVSDVFQYRSIFAITGLFAITLGLGLISLTASGGTRSSRLGNIIAGMSLITSGVFPMVPTVGSWVSNNTRTPSRQAIGLAFVMAIGGLGGLAGPFIYRESETPEYPTGIRTSFGLAAGGLLIILMLVVSYWMENKEMERREAEEAAGAENPREYGAQTYQRYML